METLKLVLSPGWVGSLIGLGEQLKTSLTVDCIVTAHWGWVYSGITGVV